MGRMHLERTISASPERVFDWLLDPANLTVSPLFGKAGWAKDFSGPGVGAVREVTGIGFWVHEQITAYDRPTATPISPSTSSRPRNTRAARSPVPRRRRHPCRLGQRLHTSGSRGRQGDRGNHLAADPLANLPRDPRRMRAGAGEVAGPRPPPDSTSRNSSRMVLHLSKKPLTNDALKVGIYQGR